MPAASTSPCPMCAGADAAIDSPLQRLLPPGASRFIAQTPRFVAVPTFGCFVPGYLLIVPRPHVLSFGQLGPGLRREADMLATRLSERIATVYGMPALGFEYGNNVPGGRRIEHAHWHLLPSRADLAGWLGQRLCGHKVAGLAGLPGDPAASYIAVRTQDKAVTVYPVPSQQRQRIRLRRVVAGLDPRVNSDDWDFEQARFPDLIRQTVRDLAPAVRTG